MKPIFQTLFLLVLISCTGQKPGPSALLFAKAGRDGFEFVEDTTNFKNHIRESMNFRKEVAFDRVRIVKQTTLPFGTGRATEFFYVMVSDTRHHYRVSRWLSQRNGNLYLNNRSAPGDQFEQMFQICVGEEDCAPEVFDIDGKKYWGCSKDPKCLKDAPDPETVKCRTYKSLIVDDLK